MLSLNQPPTTKPKTRPNKPVGIRLPQKEPGKVREKNITRYVENPVPVVALHYVLNTVKSAWKSKPAGNAVKIMIKELEDWLENVTKQV